ncbi:TetR/AcrR family transcriptional regulator [Curtobacterium sp. RRHDQ10]|uniref:TetR/AcrR family transcriptional regulator n=1 Tax=Curtobacterium phyllosphaerae TaxID=3413379 RepID=UPI003BEF56A2
MVRWEPGGKDRLRLAALDLYVRSGFEETTVAEIAAAAGLTERTFFRHFADKREVLFDGQEVLEDQFLTGVADAPDGLTPLGLAAAALTNSAGFFPEERRAWSRRRQAVISANASLQERESRKMSTLAGSLASALRDRGVVEPAATLAAQTAVTVFSVSFATWVREDETRTFAAIEHDVLDELTAMTAASVQTPAAGRPAV